MIPAPLDARTVKAQVDLAEVARRYTRLRRAGRQWRARCIFHQPDSDPSLFIDSRRFQCFGCGFSGDVFTFIMAAERCDFPAALRIAAGFLAPQKISAPDDICSPSEASEAAGGFCRQPSERGRPVFGRPPQIARKTEPRAVPVGELPPLECLAEAVAVMNGDALARIRALRREFSLLLEKAK